MMVPRPARAGLWQSAARRRRAARDERVLLGGPTGGGDRRRCDHELERQAIAAGGENVLAAILANALYGAAIGCGMLAEGEMLEQPKASGAEGPGFVGAMHWQAAHIAGPLRAPKDHEQAPLGQALRRSPGHWCCCCRRCASPNPRASTAVEVTNALTDARAELRSAEEHLRRLDEQTADLAGELDALITAAHDAMRGHDNRHTN
jgi:hypothetical protein